MRWPAGLPPAKWLSAQLGGQGTHRELARCRSHEIFVWLEKSGTAAIRITDNGEGMSPEDLALAVERHATTNLEKTTICFASRRWGSAARRCRASVPSPRWPSRRERRPVLAAPSWRSMAARRAKCMLPLLLWARHRNSRHILQHSGAAQVSQGAGVAVSHVCNVLVENRLALAGPGPAWPA